MTTAVQGLTVSWSKVTGAARYRVQWKSGAQSWSADREAVLTAAATSRTISGLIAGRTYTVRVLTVPIDGSDDLPSPESTASPTPPSWPAVATVRAHTSASGGGHYRAETLQPANPGSAASWRTTEYHGLKTPAGQLGHCAACPSPLDVIRAAQAYAACASTISNCKQGGGGRTIAVVGTTLDVDSDQHTGHSDLQGGAIFGGVTSNNPHETRVAGVAAARRNGHGIHGVAFNANLVGYNLGGSNLGFVLAQAAGRPQEVHGFFGPGSAPEGSAHIVNMSITVSGDPFIAAARAGMKIAAAAGRIMVIPAGNNPGVPTDYPALLAGEEGIAGHAILVGGLEDGSSESRGTGRVASAAHCGDDLKAWCLFAPMRGVWTTDGRYGDSNSRYRRVFGTSFAAPFVSGAAAVLWAAFPNKTGAQIVQRLLTTARQVDATNGNYDSQTGLSPIYGHGALDLGAAMNPVGWTSSLLPGGGLVPVRRSFIDLPPGFRHRPVAALRGAIVYDTQMFPFLHDLNSAFRARRAPSATSALEDFLSPPAAAWSSQRLGRWMRMEFVRSRQAIWEPLRDLRAEEIRDWRIRVEPTPALSLRFGRGFDASSDPVARRGGLFRDGFVARPFATLAGDGTAFGIDWQWGERTRLDFTGKTGSGYFGGGRAQLASLGVVRRFGAGLTLSARYGALRERGSLLGIRGSGAFRDDPDARTDFLDVGVEGRLASGAALFGSLGRGVTKGRGGSGSLVSGWRGGRGESFALGGEWPGLWRDSDRLTLLASSPFRPRGAAVSVDVPDRELADGVVAYTRHWVDLSPRGRELRLQAVYEADAAPGVAWTLGSFLRLNPDHNPEARPEFGAAAKLRLHF